MSLSRVRPIGRVPSRGLARAAAVAGALLLLWFSLRQVDPAVVWAQLRALRPADLLLLALVNALVLATFSARWWILLRAQGYALPYLQLVRYRLAAFAVSYFTPGPHFGGEPLQVYTISSRHQVPGGVSSAAVLLDKSMEMFANFVFLLGGLLLVARPGLLTDAARTSLLGAAVVLLVLPALLLALLAAGRRPVSGAWDAAARVWGRLRPGDRTAAARSARAERHRAGRAYQAVRAAEAQSTALCRSHPLWWAAAVAATLLSWAAIMAEFWLMTYVLGLRLDFGEAMTALLAARWATLLPVPAGLGALEASQVFAMQSLGLSAAAGLSMALLIRTRDVLLGLLGLALAAPLLRAAASRSRATP